jgi:hypothetical protein
MFKARTIARAQFPPWEVLELEGGYAVEDAAGRRLGTFYGRPNPVTARKDGALTMEEARQTAFDSARLAQRLAGTAGVPHALLERSGRVAHGPSEPERCHTSASRGRGVRTSAK